MVEEDEREYLERRVSQELQCAEVAESPQAVRAHYLLLSHYLDKLYPAADDIASLEHGSAGESDPA